ncbi:3 (2)-bisphosphate nucleotidase 1 [Stylonychia lemnae]|uniref:3'(2'),5'-bisphosphate nucleotidase n=1 Tax=Stylonychia lemnae TaxID=5949 RepID=A0A077ZX33_STYLE|nr:3 (2)-bisphosphate nucleotidase 1 [Stylonychia lemnae]|eukprot:CDW74136.1 3 (2)-bisphosphate nucleotidase 1 [Stylonychia lemnae]
MSSSKFVRLHDLMNTCVHLSQRATNVLKQQVYHENNFNIVQKGMCANDVYTELDLQIQKTIHYNLKQLYPRAKIICEEEESSIDENIKPSIMPDELLRMRNKQKIFSADILLNSASVRRLQYLKYLEDLLSFNYDFLRADDVKRGLDDIYNNEVLEKDLTFWIDPLDGSKGLVEGHTEHITTIIGVCIKNRPILGIVHKPFSGDALSFQSGKSYVGLPQCGLFTVLQKIQTDFENFENFTLHVPPFSRDENIDRHLFQPKICGSHNRNQDEMDKLIYATNPQRIERVAGSANKFVHMVEGQSDFYMNFVPGFKFWDMCGSEAILASRFGILTDAQKRPIFYEPNMHPTIKDGLIAAKNKSIYKLCEHRIERFTRMSLEQNHQRIQLQALESKRIRQELQELDQQQQNIKSLI